MKTTAILQLPYPESADSADVPRDIKALAEKLDPPGGGNGAFIIGEVRFVAIANPPPGWLVADGRPVSRATYAKLYVAVADVFGAGDGSTTFNLPDLRGRSVVGSGQGAGLTVRAVGTKWGVEAVVLSVAQMPSHGHSTNDPGHAHTVGSSGSTLDHSHNTVFNTISVSGVSGGALVMSVDNWTGLTNRGSQGASVNLDHVHALSASATGVGVVANGGGGGHDNTPPSIAIPAYIYAGA